MTDMNILTAREGYIFTNGEVYGKVVYLGANDSPDNWYEITEEEYRKKLEEIERNHRYD